MWYGRRGTRYVRDTLHWNWIKGLVHNPEHVDVPEYGPVLDDGLLQMCSLCGAVIYGTAYGTDRHNRWHRSL